MGAATFNLFYSFLAGLLVSRRSLRLRACGRRNATRRCFASCCRPLASAPRYDPPSTTGGDHGAAMLRIRRILRDYEDAGSLNSLIALWGFVDDHTFLTKAGHLGLVYRLAGVDFECLDHAQRRDIVHRFEAALRCLDESCRVYQYLSQASDAADRAGAVPPAGRPRGRASAGGVPERPPRRPFRARAAPGAGLRRASAASLRGASRCETCVAEPGAAFRRVAVAERDAGTGRGGPRPRARAAAPQGERLRGAARGQRAADATSQDRRLSVLPTPRELHAAHGRGRGASVRHAPRLLRGRQRARVPSRPPGARRGAGEGADDEGAAKRHVPAGARRPVHAARRVHRLSGVVPHSERPDAADARSSAGGTSSTSACRW